MNFDELAEFQRDLKALLKKYKMLNSPSIISEEDTIQIQQLIIFHPF